mgnify:CR=1 FL=1
MNLAIGSGWLIVFIFVIKEANHLHGKFGVDDLLQKTVEFLINDLSEFMEFNECIVNVFL